MSNRNLEMELQEWWEEWWKDEFSIYLTKEERLIYQTLGERFLYMRKLLQLNQIEMANIFNMPQSTISDYENNRRIPTTEMLIELIEKYKISIDWLFGYSNKISIGEKETNKTLGEQLAYLRKKLELTQKEMESIFDISYSTFSKYETNRKIPTPNLLIKLVEKYDISLDWLFGYSNNITINNNIPVWYLK